MSLVEKASISGTALSYLLSECVAADGAQEGFLLGNITREITNHISDSQQENCHTEVIINVTSMLPGPDMGYFYSSSGKIKESAILEMISNSASEVIGWYKYRRNNSLKPTMRDRIVSKELRRYFDSRDREYFLCCNITCKQNPGSATHSFTYRFSKVNQYGDLETLQDVTSNLGQDVSGYKRGIRSDRDDPFNRVVKNCGENGIANVSRAIEKALSASVVEAFHQETEIRKVSSEIGHMLRLLADHYKINPPAALVVQNFETKTNEEREFIQPLTLSLNTASARAPEPFDFVTDMIKNDLKQSTMVSSGKSSTSMFTESHPVFRETASASSNVKTENKVSGHKRIHSEGALQTSDTTDKEKNNGARNWKSSPEYPNASNNA